MRYSTENPSLNFGVETGTNHQKDFRAHALEQVEILILIFASKRINREREP